MENINNLQSPLINEGLNQEEIKARVELGLINKKSKGSSKTIVGIIFSNIFTFLT